MLPSPPTSILVLVLLRGAPAVEPPAAAACESVRRVELTPASTAAAREICVSPGFTTSLRFSAPAVVDLQDEVRFEEVVRARRLVTLMPPPDMVPGERLRLTVRFEGEESPSGMTFVLVAHEGRATHQVEVYRDKRTRESFQQEVLQERARSERLREQLARTQALLGQSGGLRGLIADRTVGVSGVRTRELKDMSESSDGGLSFVSGTSYRADKSVAAEIWLINSGTEPWTMAGASLVEAHGEELKGVKFRQEEIIFPNQSKPVSVEAEAFRGQAQGELTLKLWDAEGRAITIPRMTFP